MTVCQQRLLIRTDADTTIGTGHVMRCLAIAQTWLARGGCVAVLYRRCPENLQQRLVDEGLQLYALQHDDEAELHQFSLELEAVALLVDGYHFSPAYRAMLQRYFPHPVLLDDYISELPLHTECVINPQPLIKLGYYAELPGERVLQGLQFMPLRSEFGRDAQQTLPLSDRKRVLVTMGGTDPARLTLPLSEMLLKQLPDDVIIDAVCSRQHPDSVSLDELSNRSAGRLRLLHDVSDMASVMMNCGMALSAAGSTIWELVAMQLPCVLVIVAENQRVVRDYPYWYAVLDAVGIETEQVSREVAQQASSLWFDTECRARYVATMQSLALGQGSSRICDCLESLIASPMGAGQS